MKNNTMGRFIKGIIGAALVGLVTFTWTPAKAAPHDMIYAVDTANNLINFWSDDPANILDSYNITGLQNNEEIRGIDCWFDGTSATLYGLGSSSRLYTIDPTTGTATQVGAGQFSPLLTGQTFGFDNGPAGLQVVSGLGGGQSLLVSRGTGAVLSADPNVQYAPGDANFGVPPRVDGLTYDVATGTWYAADTLQNSLAIFNPITGFLNTIGLLGIDASRLNGLDMCGTMYLGTPAASSDPQANLYWVNPMTGMANLIGQIGQPGDDYLIRGLTVCCIPEPSSLTLLALGAFGLLVARRRH